MEEFSKVKPIAVFDGQNDPAVELFLRSADGMYAGGVCPEIPPEADVIAPDGYVTVAEARRGFGSTQNFIARFRHFFPLLDVDFSLGKIKSRTVNIMAVRQALAEDALAATFNHRDVERVLSVVFFGGREELSFEEFKLVYFSWLSFCSDDVVAAERLLPSDLPPRLRETDQVLQPGDVSTEKRWQELFAVWKRAGEILQDLWKVPAKQRIAIRVSCDEVENEAIRVESPQKSDQNIRTKKQKELGKNIDTLFEILDQAGAFSDLDPEHLPIALAVTRGAFDVLAQKYPERVVTSDFEDMTNYLADHPQVLIEDDNGKIPMNEAFERVMQNPGISTAFDEMNHFLEMQVQADLDKVVEGIPGADGWDLLNFIMLLNWAAGWRELRGILERQ